MVSFVLITYNQEEFVLQCLESIRYQITTYGQGRTFEFILCDDASSDRTYDLICGWLEKNGHLFEHVSAPKSEQNLGTTKNITNGFERITGDFVKLVSGDDMLPRSSIFPLIDRLKEYDIVMGLPLYVYEDRVSTTEAVKMIARELMDSHLSYADRMNHYCFLHAVSLAYRRECLQNSEMLDFIRTFKFMEDYPLFLWIAQNIPTIRYTFVPEFAMLYRRTNGSIYIIRKGAFYQDRMNIINYILQTTNSLKVKLLRWNEKLAFKISTRFAKYLIWDNYIFLIKLHFFRKKAINVFQQNCRESLEINEDFIYKFILQKNSHENPGKENTL